MARPINLPKKGYPLTFTIKYSTAEISEPVFNPNVTAVWRDPETKEFVIETLFEDIRLPGDMETEIVIGGD